MIFSVKVIPKASHVRIVPYKRTSNSNVASRKLVKEEGSGFKVYLTKPAQDGLANEQLVSLLSAHLKIKKYQIKIIKGERCRNKLVEIT
ncbi:MAG: DUF167 domain-containing protein [Candidatus Omnitrophota bacterium]|nr:DUF167 domain-containing protein [Candidatus Omnitrophota bacterium]